MDLCNGRLTYVHLDIVHFYGVKPVIWTDPLFCIHIVQMSSKRNVGPTKITVVDCNFGPFKIKVVDRNFRPSKTTIVVHYFGPSKITIVDRNFRPSFKKKNVLSK